MDAHTAKSTYSLDSETADALAALARRWQISEADALCRAVRQTAVRERVHQPEKERTPAQRAAVLRELQESLAARGVDFDAWLREAEAIRHSCCDDPSGH